MKQLYALAFILSTIGSIAQISTDSLILYLPFNGDVLDYSGYGNHGTAFDVTLDTNRFGEPNSSYKFNGLSSYIEIPASPSMNSIQTVDEVTITAWININQWHISGNVFSIFERYNPMTDSGWLLEANWVGGGILFLADESNMNNWIGCNYSMNFDEWYHLGFTYSQADGMAYFYINGENVCSSAYTPPINVADTTASFIIGRSLAGPDEYSDGLIDEYKIYSRILSAEEIEETFELGREELTTTEEINVYPNPAEDQLTIQAMAKYNKSTYTITDMAGKILLTGKLGLYTTNVNVMSLAAGVYIITVDGEEKMVSRFIKK